MTTMTSNFNLDSTPTRRFRQRLRAKAADPQSRPLRAHPKWHAFILLLDRYIMSSTPQLRPQFLELLDQADLL